MVLEVYELVYRVLAGDACDKIAFVVHDSVRQIFGCANEKCPVAFACEDIGAVGFIHVAGSPGITAASHYKIPAFVAVRRIGMTKETAGVMTQAVGMMNKIAGLIEETVGMTREAVETYLIEE